MLPAELIREVEIEGAGVADLPHKCCWRKLNPQSFSAVKSESNTTHCHWVSSAAGCYGGCASCPA